MYTTTYLPTYIIHTYPGTVKKTQNFLSPERNVLEQLTHSFTARANTTTNPFGGFFYSFDFLFFLFFSISSRRQETITRKLHTYLSMLPTIRAAPLCQQIRRFFFVADVFCFCCSFVVAVGPREQNKNNM
ncbi:hypothetical protein F4809DRAFT_271304 [Biscogniauxia mediterranea]|nr:hypothetical protein F4809DRAFT_271304 [Biscogniauxia mediterranea]